MQYYVYKYGAICILMYTGKYGLYLFSMGMPVPEL